MLVSHAECHVAVTADEAPRIPAPIMAVGDGGRQRVHVPVHGFLVRDARLGVQEEPAPRNVSHAGAEGLARVAHRALHAVYDRLDQLRAAGIDRLVVSPHGAFHFAPLHLAGPPGEPLADHFVVTYLANLTQLLARPVTTRRREGAAVFALSYGDQPQLPYLSSSAAEGQAIVPVSGVDHPGAASDRPRVGGQQRLAVLVRDRAWNATVMIVLDADRFGVSQLHQLRGRVGRGSAAGLCLLVTEAVEGTPARERLDAVASTTDGFRLAELDLEQRRAGDVLGATQSGRRSHLRLLSLLKESELIRNARVEAIALVEEDPELNRHPELAASVAAMVDEERSEYLEKG